MKHRSIRLSQMVGDRRMPDEARQDDMRATDRRLRSLIVQDGALSRAVGAAARPTSRDSTLNRAAVTKAIALYLWSPANGRTPTRAHPGAQGPGPPNPIRKGHQRRDFDVVIDAFEMTPEDRGRLRRARGEHPQHSAIRAG
jgi:hypothetical protein